LFPAGGDVISDGAASDVGPPRRLSHAIEMIVFVLAVVPGFVLALRTALNNDVTYALGGIETAGRGGVSIWDVFVARPVAYRLLLDSLDQGRSIIAGDASLTVRHVVIRLETDVLIIAVGTVLFFGLRRYLGRWPAAAIALATTAALLISPPWHFLEPDWVAALAGVLAVAAACAPRSTWVGAVLGAFAVVGTIAVKLATAPIGLLALLLVAALSPRRAVRAAGISVVLAVAWYLVTKRFLPWEWVWLKDQANLVQHSPIHHAPRWQDVRLLLEGVGNVAIISPLVAMAPAAATALIRRSQPGRKRWFWAGYALLIAGLSVASAYGQGEFFMYHFAIVPVVAAGVWGAAYGLCDSARVPLVAGTVIVTVASAVLLRMPAQWRLHHLHVAAAAYTMVAIAAAVSVHYAKSARPTKWTSNRPMLVLCAVAVGAALLPATAPKSPYAFSTYDYDFFNGPPRSEGYDDLSARLGRDTPVLYLTFGSINYVMGNPTTCRYPSPQWLQRGSIHPRVRKYSSYADNLRCLTDDQPAKYLIWSPAWFSIARASPQVRSLLESRFDCSPAARVPAPPDLVVCTARRP
jgi:hypothetical protein